MWGGYCDNVSCGTAENKRSFRKRTGSRKVQVNLIDDPRVGDYVVVHAGFAIEKVEERQALDDIAMWEEFEAAMKEASAEVEKRVAMRGLEPAISSA